MGDASSFHRRTRAVNSRLLLRLLLPPFLLAGSFTAAVIESMALLPTLVVCLSFLGLFVAAIAGAITRRWGALKLSALVFVTATAGNIGGYVTYLKLRAGNAAVAENLVRAADEHHRERGRYPEKLEELVPGYLSQLPPAPFGQKSAPYVYFSDGREFTLSYPTGFKTAQRYESRTRRWASVD